MHTFMDTHKHCIYFRFAVIPTGYLETFLCITTLRHFHLVFENHFFIHKYREILTMFVLETKAHVYICVDRSH